ncbi:hypothetical protein [Methanoculleus receptaculi]|uniref:Uncharacterized protein n=1 Tax=Methanoculleus receptaculi TaxID=394967 RepID=A0AAX4FW36_9EURY|nr:hypothetical protein [Methanoculleus receptaculi]WOX57409.1 hypothetical protein R6Y96_08945 [Methanoculleus receptaculi]
MIGSGAAGSRVRHRLRDYGHHEALCESPVAGVALVEGIKEESGSGSPSRRMARARSLRCIRPGRGLQPPAFSSTYPGAHTSP